MQFLASFIKCDIDINLDFPVMSCVAVFSLDMH